MIHNFSSDKSIQDVTDDKFQRYNFSKKIAEGIITNSNEDGLVIGINGAWGDGKTSVMNFIEKELRLENSISVIKFNPWRYNNEEELVKNLLKKIANELGKELEGIKQILGQAARKYGSIGDIFGFDITKIGEALSEVDLEELKNRVDEFLNLSKRKIVILVDDIDRLDKHEIYSLFKLVKLTADFKYTTYILSFDEDMVANAIGERFGESNNNLAGKNFLEKIIQIPLKLPQIQISSLKDFCLELLNKAIEQNNIFLEKNEAQSFTYQFTQHLLFSLKTPRLAVRYANSVSFALALLKDEVNYVDLMLIEGVKILYPTYYEYIKLNAYLFTSSYESNSLFLVDRIIDENKKELIDNLESLSQTLTSKEKTNIKNLLVYLFPRLREALYNNFEHEGLKKWNREKRIGSINYASKYFLYDVVNGEIPDIVFTNFIKMLEDEKIEEISTNIDELIKTTTPDTFLFKIEDYNDNLNDTQASNLVLAIALNSDQFQKDKSLFNYGVGGSQNQAAIFIFSVLKKLTKEKAFEIAQLLMSEKIEFNFSFKINEWLRSEDEKLFDEQQFLSLANSLRCRALSLSHDRPIFITYPEYSEYLFATWNISEPESLQEYLETVFFNDPLKIKDFILSYTLTMWSSSEPEPYKTDFKILDYESIIKILDKNYIYKQIQNAYSEEIIKEPVQFNGRENKQTDLNALRQFNHWYINDVENVI